MKGLHAATVRAWAQAANIPVGSRGAIAAEVYNAYIRAQVVRQLRRSGRAAGRLALYLGPGLARAAADRRTRRE